MHEIWDQKALFDRVPAWHRVGHVVKEPKSASMAWQIIGSYDIQLVPLSIAPDTDFSNAGSRVGHNAICRMDANGNPDHTYSIVRSGYQIIPPGDFPSIWDEVVNTRVESMFVMRHGSMFGITSEIRTVDISGDEVTMYLLGLNTYDGSSACRVSITPVRVVCMNTLIAGLGAAKMDIRIHHRGHEDISSLFKESLIKAMGGLDSNVDKVEESMRALAGKRISDSDALKVISASFPMPKQNDKQIFSIASGSESDRYKRHMERRAQIKEMRDTAMGLYSGSDTNTIATRGTAWGAVNAVAETVDYYVKSSNGVTAAEGSIIGDRSVSKRRAWVYAMGM